MNNVVKWALAAVGALSLSACHADARYDAARDVGAFLRAASLGDKAAFEAHLDRPALAANLAGQGVAHGDLEALLRPRTFAFGVKGDPQNELPGRASMALALRWLDEGRVCLPPETGSQRCALIFKKERDGWKLISIQSSLFRNYSQT